MPQTVDQTFDFEATVHDPYDGVIRLLNDAQRYGCELVRLQLHVNKQDETVLSASLALPKGVDRGNVLDRISRHYAVLVRTKEPA